MDKCIWTYHSESKTSGKYFNTSCTNKDHPVVYGLKTEGKCILCEKEIEVKLK